MKKTSGFGMYLHGLLAFLACPCHAHFYVIWLSGTSLGAYLLEYEVIFFLAMAISFPIFVLMVVRSHHLRSKRLEAQEKGVCADDICDTCYPKKANG